METSDEEIVRSVVGGNGESFGILAERYIPKLLRYTKTLLSDADEAEDCVQDTLIKVFQNIRSFDSTRRFSPWIYRIAHNESMNLIQRRKKSISLSLPDFDLMFPHLHPKNETEALLDKEALRRNLHDFIDRLDVKYREPLHLYYFEEMSYEEIADVLKIPVSTVGIRLRRGRAALNILLNGKNNGTKT